MDSKTWWIIIAIIVVIAILVLIAAWQGKRRTAAKRDEAQQLRARAHDNEGTVVESRQRAETAEEQAERARAEAEEKQRRADELEAEAEHEKKAAAAVERDHEETLKKADRLDPDTPTDRHGNRIEGGGSRHDADDSAIDPVTDRPVEESARQHDVHAERPVQDGRPVVDEGRPVQEERPVGDGQGPLHGERPLHDDRPAAEQERRMDDGQRPAREADGPRLRRAEPAGGDDVPSEDTEDAAQQGRDRRSFVQRAKDTVKGDDAAPEDGGETPDYPER